MLSRAFGSSRHTNTPPHSIYFCSRRVPRIRYSRVRVGVTDCRRAERFLVSALLLLSEATISLDTAGRSPPRNHIRERAEGVTNHITSTDSLQSLCSLGPVLCLCLDRSEWRFMARPVGRRVMRYRGRLCLWDVLVCELRACRCACRPRRSLSWPGFV